MLIKNVSLSSRPETRETMNVLIHLAAGIGMKKNVSCEGGGEINKKVTQLSAVCD